MQQALAGLHEVITDGMLGFRRCAARDFVRAVDEAPFDIAVAIRVGALDGRHPGERDASLAAITGALTRRSRLFLDGGTPLREIDLATFRK